MTQVCGLLHGPMASGKTETLLACAQLLAPNFHRVIAIKSDTDTRWGGKHIRARSGLQLSASSCSSLSGVFPQPGTLLVVDEAQFFPDLLSLYTRVLEEIRPGCGLIAAGLSEDSRGEPFGQVQSVAALLATAKLPHVFSEPLYAVCSVPDCGRPAAHTALAAHDVGGSDNNLRRQVSVGDIGQYQPMCSNHFSGHFS